MVMTTDEAKDFVLWCRANGVQQCSFNGLTFMLLPRAIRAGDEFVVTERAQIQPELKTTDLEGLFDG